jgi:6-phospho-beta-glucosidase
MVTEAILKYTNLKTIGLCNIPTHLKHTIAEQQQVSPDAVVVDYFGINHLSWVRDVTIDGQSQMDQVRERYIDFITADDNPLFSRELIETLGMIPSYYLSFYYNHSRMLAEQIQGPQTRAERVMEIEEDLFHLYGDERVVEKPDLLGERGGRYYSVAAIKLIAAICNDTNERHILNVRNQNTFTCLPPETVVEVPCMVNAMGAQPLPIEPIPLQAFGLMTAVKTSEQLTIKAAVSGDQQLALQALMNHPLVPSFEVAQSLLAVLLAENSDYLPQFELDTVLQL